MGINKNFFKNILIFLSVAGPGIITATVDNDAGGITVYSLAGAEYGYALLWTMIPITVALIVVQEICARMGVVTGKGLADLIRENYGVKVTFYTIVILIFSNLLTTMSEFSGIAASMEIFGISKYISVPLAALIVWWLVVKGTYKSVEKVFLTAALFYLSYVVSGILAKPDWGEVVYRSFVPEIKLDTKYFVMVVGIIGTTITPWMQFYLQSAIVEKGVKVEEYKLSRWDVIIGGLITDIVAFFIIVACAATIFKAGIHVETVKDAAMALEPLAGKYSASLFAFGLFNASLLAASVLPLSTAYYVCEGMGWEAGVNKRFREAPHFFSLYTALIAIGAGVVLIPRFPLLKMMFFSQVINGVILPIVLVIMLLLVNKKEIMGEHTNTRFQNVVAWTTVVTVIVFTLLMLGTMIC